MVIFCTSILCVGLLQWQGLSKDRLGHVAGLLVPKSVAQYGSLRGPAPDFIGQDATGRPIQLKLVGKRPVVLVFIDRDCPYTRNAKTYFDQIQHGFGNDAMVLGVIDANQDDAGEWVEAAVPKFRLALDPDLKIAKSYGATNGLFTVLIGPDRKIVKSWPGFSKSMLEELTGLLSTQPGVHQKPKLTFGPAPLDLTWGNPLTPQDKK